MSETVDTNVLVHATHTASEFHEPARDLMARLGAGPGLVYLLWPTLFGYLRIVTHPGILGSPLSSQAAAANVQSLLTRPHVRAVGEAEGFWAVYRATADVVRPRGNLVPDAHMVALMHQHGIRTIWSQDRDLLKFGGIEVRDPFR